MHKLSRHDLDPEAVETAEQLLTEHAPILATVRSCAASPTPWSMPPTPTGREPIDDQLQQDRRYLELKQRRDGMWHLAGRLTNTARYPTERDPGPVDETPQ